jgi:hydrogenase maturation protein HypF
MTQSLNYNATQGIDTGRSLLAESELHGPDFLPAQVLHFTPTPEFTRISFTITGIVQGVGFRPFVYRIATTHQLDGTVRNESGCVIVEVEGRRSQIEDFIRDLLTKSPPLSCIHRITSYAIPVAGVSGFRIVESTADAGDVTLLCPDVAICEECLQEMNDPHDRRYRYPFINCTNCGPRFSIVEEMPYDRGRTTMNKFELCDECRKEYHDPSNRRFHAEPVACAKCGPQLAFVRCGDQVPVLGEAALLSAIDDLKSGAIVAIKGIGGFHLACIPFDEAAVSRLRRRKGRPSRPLAVMFRDVVQVRRCCVMSEDEERLLRTHQRPILSLEKVEGNSRSLLQLARSISPRLTTVGAFLPYAPLHHLLLADSDLPALVMTSGNRSEEPIVVENEDAGSRLGSIADSCLYHDRRIWNRCDDSVGYVTKGSLVLTRRSRGYAPLPVQLPHPVRPTLALGANYCNTITLATGNQAFISQHIGDVENQETLDYLVESVSRLKHWLKIEPEVMVCDMHPDLLTTRLAGEIARDLPLRQIQHHEAHFASILTARQIAEPVIGIVCDGTGYSPDGTIWGGELLFDDTNTISRCGHLGVMPLPGGDTAIRHPWRTAVAYCQLADPNLELTDLPDWNAKSHEEVSVVRQMVLRKFNTVMTSSAGRLFDAVSALLGICFESTYEGQAAIELEHCAKGFKAKVKQKIDPGINFRIDRSDDMAVIDVTPALRDVVSAIRTGEKVERIAYNFHLAFGNVLADCAIDSALQRDVHSIALSGGVFQNRILIEIVNERIQAAGLKPILPGEIPVNDAGISLGQVVLAGRMDDKILKGIN